MNTKTNAELNRAYARAFWDHPIDERNNTYWHDDDTTPPDENGEWRPLPDFCAQLGREAVIAKLRSETK